MSDHVEVLVVGGGPGGYVAALRAATYGARVLLADPAPLGGVCLHEGCIPSKLLLHAAQLHQEARTSPWLTGTADLALDLDALQRWKADVVARLAGGVGGLLAHRDVEVATSRVRFTGPHTARLDDAAGTREVRFDRAVIATGSAAVDLPDVPGLSAGLPGVLSSREVLELRVAPARVVVVGAGYVGLELATLLRDLGSEVDVVEAADRVLPAMEPTVTQVVQRALSARGVRFHLSSTVTGYRDRAVEATKPGGASTRLSADAVVVAIGRRPSTDDLGLDALGVRVDERGFVPVDQELRTEVGHVHAIGDVTAGAALAHRAMAQGKVAGANAAGRHELYAPVAVPGVVYTRPEIASVGLTSREAADQGLDAEVSTVSLAGNGRVLSLGGTGSAVAVSDRATGLLLGLHVVAPQASELAGAAALMLEMGALSVDVADTVWPHPTVSEGLGELADAVQGLAVHALGRQPRRATTAVSS